MTLGVKARGMHGEAARILMHVASEDTRSSETLEDSEVNPHKEPMHDRVQKESRERAARRSRLRRTVRGQKSRTVVHQ